MKSSQEMFDQLKPQDNYHLFDLATKLPLYYGIDNKGRYSIYFESVKPCKELYGTKILGIFCGKRNDGKYITYISLEDDSYKPIFFCLCDDIVSLLNGISDNQSGYQAFIDRIKRWKRMFSSKSNLLSDIEIQGLYGELYFMDTFMFHTFGKEKAIKAWGGPQGMSKDFSIDLDWYEVKCINSNSDKISIASEQQLSSENPGHLVVIRTEAVPEGFENGIATINELFQKITRELSQLPDSLELFLDCLHKRGYAPEEEYEKIRFNVIESKFYLVDNNFPTIKISEDSRCAIGKVTYELLINALDKYLEEQGNHD